MEVLYNLRNKGDERKLKMLIRMFWVLLIAICTFSFASTANAAGTEIVYKPPATYDKTRGVSISTTLYINAEKKNNVNYYSIKKMTGTIKILDNRTSVKNISVKLAQNGPHTGGRLATNQIKTENINPNKFYSFTSYPNSNWKPVLNYRGATIVGSIVTVDLQRGSSKWSFNHSNNFH